MLGLILLQPCQCPPASGPALLWGWLLKQFPSLEPAIRHVGRTSLWTGLDRLHRSGFQRGDQKALVTPLVTELVKWRGIVVSIAPVVVGVGTGG